MLEANELKRFENKFVKGDPNECWIWRGRPTASGYCQFWLKGKFPKAHRLSYEQYVGPIPEGLTIDHECHNADKDCNGGPKCPHRACVNPSHLAAKTLRENLLASDRTVTSQNYVKKVCPQGHEYDTIIGSERRCSVCSTERSQKFRDNMAANKEKYLSVRVDAKTQARMRQMSLIRNVNMGVIMREAFTMYLSYFIPDVAGRDVNVLQSQNETHRYGG